MKSITAPAPSQGFFTTDYSPAPGSAAEAKHWHGPDVTRGRKPLPTGFVDALGEAARKKGKPLSTEEQRAIALKFGL